MLILSFMILINLQFFCESKGSLIKGQWRIFQWWAFEKNKKIVVQMTTDTVKNVKMTTESVVNFVFFETLATEKSATEYATLML